MPEQIQVQPGDQQVNKLVVPDPLNLQKELGLVDPESLKADEVTDPKLIELADSYTEKLLSVKVEDFETQLASRSAVENMGLSIQHESARRSEMLREPIKALAHQGDDGGNVANDLIRLKIEVERHDPNKWSFEGGWFSRMLGQTPIVGEKVKAYFIQFEEARTVIDDIARSLKIGRDRLRRDSDILRGDQVDMRKLTLKFQKNVKLAMLIDKRIETKIAGLSADDPQKTFLEQQLLFPLRRRINALQTSLGFHQIGVLGYETIIETNIQLIEGINLALDTTITGLTVATVLSLALAHQKDQLNKLLATNQATAKLFVETTERLRKQGVDIQKMASSEMIPVEMMKTAFVNVHAAIDELKRFRSEALPQMAKSIRELDQLTTGAEKAIQDMERGKRVRPAMKIEVE